jgi:hypothetical protein
MDGGMYGWMGWWMDVCLDGWMDGWMDEWMDGFVFISMHWFATDKFRISCVFFPFLGRYRGE